MSREVSGLDAQKSPSYQPLTTSSQPSWVAALLSGEEVAFTTQTLEGRPAPFTSCSALTVHIKAGSNDEDVKDAIEFRVTSRCGSLEGEVCKTCKVVSYGECLQIFDEEQAPMATIGHLSGGSPDSLWLSGSLSVDLDEWWKYDEKGVFLGFLKAGDTAIEIFGVTEAAFKNTSSIARSKTLWHLMMMLIDPVLEVNAAGNFIYTGKYVQGSLTIFLAILAALQGLFELQRYAHMNGRTVYDFWMFNIKKSWHAGLLSRNVMLLKVNDIYEVLVLHSIVACGLLTDHSTMNYSTGLSLFGIVSAASEAGCILNAFTEHYTHASRMKFEQAASGKSFMAFTQTLKGLCSPVLTLGLLSNLIVESFPSEDMVWPRRGMITFLSVVVAISWYIVAVVIPHCIFLGGVRAPQALTEICAYAFQCNVSGEAPVYVKRTSWSPYFHLYKLLISNIWTGVLLLVFFHVVPEAWEVSNDHLLPFLEVSSMQEFTRLIAPHSFILLSWIVGIIAGFLCEVILCIVAQTGCAYPGLRFGSPTWPIVGVGKYKGEQLESNEVDGAITRKSFY